MTTNFEIEPSSLCLSKYRAREVFMNAVKSVSPETYSQLIKIKRGNCSEIPTAQRLSEWADEWNLGAPWVVNRAADRIDDDFEGLEPVVISVPHRLSDVISPESLPDWEASSDLKRSFIRLAETRVIDTLDHPVLSLLSAPDRSSLKFTLMDQIRNHDECIKKRCLEVREAGKPLWVKSQDTTFWKRNARWTVEYQILRKNFSIIAGSEFDVSTVSRAVNDFLQLIELPRRSRIRIR